MTRRAALGLAMVLLSAGCSGDSESGGCTPIEQIVEPGAAAIHVLDGADVEFELSPPTSGTHQLPAPAGGVSADPIPEARQVSALEHGSVIIQYSPAVEASDIGSLEALASDDVIVAPAIATLDDEAIVALTAWSHRSLCSAVDIDAALAFIDDRVGVYFSDHD